MIPAHEQVSYDMQHDIELQSLKRDWAMAALRHTHGRNECKSSLYRQKTDVSFSHSLVTYVGSIVE